jgi:hypothetical protein
MTRVAFVVLGMASFIFVTLNGSSSGIASTWTVAGTNVLQSADYSSLVGYLIHEEFVSKILKGRV